ncbi:MAG: hypothetical protein P9M13_07470 [Candidatus Ancaeobacter aquaticus]|nr:hypothetical protein [Candidatus Ancaeobacter aquaticus]
MAQPGGGNKQTVMVLVFAAGVLVGMNWPKIKQVVSPIIENMTEKSADVYSGIAKFMAEQKENVEDTVAAAKVRKVKKKPAKSAGNGKKSAKSTIKA